MWPTFEIYNNIINGSGWLWPEGYTNTVRLNRLLNAIQPVAECRPDVFFSELLPLLDSPSSPALAKLRCEVMNLVLHSGSAGSCCDGAFLQLPATGYRQQFCHLLTGFTLGGYDQWMNRIAASAQDGQCRLYFRRRMMEKLESFIEIRAWPGESPQSKTQMVYLSQAAICILYTKLAGDDSLAATGFCARNRLQQQLCESGLADATCSSLMSIYDKLTAQALPAPANITAPVNAAIPPTTADAAFLQLPAVTEAELKNLLTDWKSGVDAVKQGLGTTLKDGEPSALKERQVSNRLLDPHEVQEMLGISKATMCRYRKKGLLPYTLVCGKYWYAEADVKKFIRITRI
jgi:predicted DNA-binding transcriptional regulator AlpA